MAQETHFQININRHKQDWHVFLRNALICHCCSRDSTLFQCTIIIVMILIIKKIFVGGQGCLTCLFYRRYPEYISDETDFNEHAWHTPDSGAHLDVRCHNQIIISGWNEYCNMIKILLVIKFCISNHNSYVCLISRYCCNTLLC